MTSKSPKTHTRKEAEAEYHKVVDPAWAKYQELKALAQIEYRKYLEIEHAATTLYHKQLGEL